MNKVKVLSIAGTDPTAGAGISADLEAFTYFNCQGQYAITAVNAQDNDKVACINPQPLNLVKLQIESASKDLKAVKTGMLVSAEVIELVASFKFPNLVCDPVLRSSSGYDLFINNLIPAFREKLFPTCRLFTPNIPEAESFLNFKINTKEDTEKAARELIALGLNAVLIKGGHSNSEESADYLYSKNENIDLWLSAKKQSFNLRGTGCRLSSAIAANLAIGHNLTDSLNNAKKYINSLFEMHAKKC